MDPPQATIIAALIGAAVGVFGTIGTLWAAKRARNWQVRDKETDNLRQALASLEQLTAEHISAIDSVVRPVLISNDFTATYEKYQAFTHDPKFPVGYDGAKGVMEQALSSGRFRRTPVQEKLKQALLELHRFQTIGFLLKLSSHKIADSMTHANQLLEQLKAEAPDGPSIERHAQQVTGQFQKALASLSETDGLLVTEVPKQLRTESDVVQLIKLFCREWQRHAEMNLYGRRGLNRTLGELRFLLPSVKPKITRPV